MENSILFFSIFPESSSHLENATKHQLTSTNCSDDRKFPSSCEEKQNSFHPVETWLKLSLIFFLTALLIYHIYQLVMTENFESETCDIDNHSNNLFIYWALYFIYIFETFTTLVLCNYLYVFNVITTWTSSTQNRHKYLIRRIIQFLDWLSCFWLLKAIKVWKKIL